jgi:hypothetical protein
MTPKRKKFRMLTHVTLLRGKIVSLLEYYRKKAALKSAIGTTVTFPTCVENRGESKIEGLVVGLQYPAK